MERRVFLIGAGGLLGHALFKPVDAVAAMAGGWVDSWWGETDGSDLPPATDPGVPSVLPGTFCEGILRLKSVIHGDAYEFRYRNAAGEYNQQVLASLNWFLRCRDGTWQHMDLRIVETLNYLSAILGVPTIQINSGYRSPDYNRKLAGQNENVARNSLHQWGQAVDFNIPGIAIKDVCSYTLHARNVMGYGGVGYYPKSNFVHLDSGRRKEWVR